MVNALDIKKAPRSSDLRAQFPGLNDGEASSIVQMLPAFRIVSPETWRSGVIFASPHSGQSYPDSLCERSALSASQLRRNEDMFVDQLFSAVPGLGAPLLCATFPRCFVDVNRAPGELPKRWAQRKAPKPETVRAKAGLGVIPTHIGERLPIYKDAISRDDAHARLHFLYEPYHTALAELLEESNARFGQALLIDCHSMPGFSAMGSRRPDIVLGDRFGRSCQPETLNRVRRLFQDHGYSVAVNYPYAGGYVTDHYGRPDAGSEALQIEINRDLYLNPVTFSPKPGYRRLHKTLSAIAQTIIDDRRPQALAAQ